MTTLGKVEIFAGEGNLLDEVAEKCKKEGLAFIAIFLPLSGDTPIRSAQYNSKGLTSHTMI